MNGMQAYIVDEQFDIVHEYDPWDFDIDSTQVVARAR